VKIVNNIAALGFGGARPIASGKNSDKLRRRQTLPGFPWDGIFRSIDEIEAYFAGDRIQCLLCGRSMKRLGDHVSKIHGTTVDAYQERFGLPWSRGLTCDSLHQTAAALGKGPERVARLLPFRITKENGPYPHKHKDQPFKLKMKLDGLEKARRNKKP